MDVFGVFITSDGVTLKTDVLPVLPLPLSMVDFWVVVAVVAERVVFNASDFVSIAGLLGLVVIAVNVTIKLLFQFHLMIF